MRAIVPLQEYKRLQGVGPVPASGLSLRCNAGEALVLLDPIIYEY